MGAEGTEWMSNGERGATWTVSIWLCEWQTTNEWGNPICSNCGGAVVLGEVPLEEQHLRIENVRLKHLGRLIR